MFQWVKESLQVQRDVEFSKLCLTRWIAKWVISLDEDCSTYLWSLTKADFLTELYIAFVNTTKASATWQQDSGMQLPWQPILLSYQREKETLHTFAEQILSAHMLCLVSIVFYLVFLQASVFTICVVSLDGRNGTQSRYKTVFFYS